MLNFGQKVEEKSGDIIPKNTLLWAVINLREIKNSRETNGRYLDIELTIADNQPHNRRKIWTKIADPFDTNNSEEWRAMGYGAIRRILEAVKGATPENANSYALNQLQDLHGLMVPVIVGVEQPKKDSQYQDEKNTVEFLSPYSSVKKITESFRLLTAGVHLYGKPPASASVPGQGSILTGTGSPPPVAGPQIHSPAPAAAGSAPSWFAPPGAPTPANAAPVHTVPAQVPANGPFVPGQAVQTQAPMPAGAVTPAPSSGMNPSAPPGHVAQTAPSSPSNNWSPPPAQFPVAG